MKTQATGWGEIFVNRTTDKRRLSGIYKELSTYNIKNSIRKWAKAWRDISLRAHADGEEAQEEIFNIATNREIEIPAHSLEQLERK